MSLSDWRKLPEKLGDRWTPEMKRRWESRQTGKYFYLRWAYQGQRAYHPGNARREILDLLGESWLMGEDWVHWFDISRALNMPIDGVVFVLDHLVAKESIEEIEIYHYVGECFMTLQERMVNPREVGKEYRGFQYAYRLMKRERWKASKSR